MNTRQPHQSRQYSNRTLLLMRAYVFLLVLGTLAGLTGLYVGLTGDAGPRFWGLMGTFAVLMVVRKVVGKRFKQSMSEDLKQSKASSPPSYFVHIP